jgi:microcystin-dependent protein
MTSVLSHTFDLPATARPTVGDLKMSIVESDHLGWLRCDGRALSTAEYRTLFTVMGYRFGGSGNTFYLPDPQGRVLGCKGTASGISGETWNTGDVSGEETHVLTTDELPPHNHDVAGTSPETGPGYTTFNATGITNQTAGTHAHTGVTDPSGTHLHTGTTVAEGNHNHSASSTLAGSHNHTYTDAYFAENRSGGTNNVFGTSGSTDTDNSFYYRTSGGGYSTTPSDINTGSVGDHNHTITVGINGVHQHAFTTSQEPNHVHTFLSDTSGSHTHAITDPTHRHQIASVGESAPFSLMQPTLFIGSLFVYSGRPFHNLTQSDGITPPTTYPNVFPLDPDHEIF